MARTRRTPNPLKRNKFVAAIVEGKTQHEAADIAGFSHTSIPSLVTDPRVKAAIETGLSDAAVAAGVSRAWVISKLKEITERCMQARPVLNKLGYETGLYVFDASGANRSLELIGKHLRVFGDDASASAQLGASVMRLLAQEAQQGRFQKAVDADIVPTRAGPTGPAQSAGPGPISAEGEVEPKTSVSACVPVIQSDTVTISNPSENATPASLEK